MRDTNDMMEDAICEDTMMECTGDGGGLEDLVNLASNIADSAPSIRDAAERLLTLLGVDDEDDETSSSEDEGVEVDIEESDSEDQPEDTRLLHQLAASLAQELKYAKQNSSNNKLAQINQNLKIDIHGKEDSLVQSMDFAHDINPTNHEIPSAEFSQVHIEDSNPFVKFGSRSFGLSYQNDGEYVRSHVSRNHHHHHHHHHNQQQHQQRHNQHLIAPPPYQYKMISDFDNREQQKIYGEKNLYHHHNHRQHHHRTSNFLNYQTSVVQGHEEENHTEMTPAYTSSSSSSSSSSSLHDYRTRIEDNKGSQLTDADSWGIGWDACATEALRYLLEDEGLPPNHPTVVAMKNHLDLQRARVLSQFAS